jgi:diaminopimelate decarboxylase
MEYIKGELHWGKVKLSDIAQTVDTPFYLYNYGVIKSAFRRVDNAFNKVDHLLCYAVKANSNLNLLKLIAEWGYGAEVVSKGELFLALKAKFNPEKIIFSGVGKSETEIDYAIKNNILLFNTESWEEIKIIDKFAKKYNKIQKILIRVNPDINPETHPYTSTGLKSDKFGVKWKKAQEIFKKSKNLKNIDLVGIHIHIGSQITKKEPFIKCSKFIKKCIKTLKKSIINLKYINIGGGLGIDYEYDFTISDKREKHLTPEEWAEIFLSNSFMKDKIVIIEPGRFVMAEGGILITRILYKKTSFGKNFYIVDAGMNDFMRPTLYNAYHKIIPLVKKDKKQITVDVVGPLCESGDFLAKNRKLPLQKSGDMLAILTSGAYGRCLSSNYNSRLRIPEVLIKNNKFSIIRNKENEYELLRNQSFEPIWENIKNKKSIPYIKNKDRLIPFSKFSATGNDFIIIDNRENILKGINLKDLSIHLSKRTTSIGADGVIIIQNANKGYSVLFYNPDGSIPESCGNGIRAVSIFLHKYVNSLTEQIIESKDGIHYTFIHKNKPEVQMFVFEKSLKKLTVNINNKKLNGHFINSGVPHFVIITENIENQEPMDLAKKLRYSKIFSPDGTNVDFIKKINPNTIILRTYERGVEGETLSCGTGAVASYYIGRRTLKLKSPLNIITRGGKLTVFQKGNRIFLSGEVREVFSGVFNLKDIK